MSNKPLDQHNPFSELPGAANPYAAPPLSADAIKPWEEISSRDQVLSNLRIPATILLILAVLMIVYRVVDGGYAIVYVTSAGPGVYPQGYLEGLIAGVAFVIVTNLVVIAGCLAMFKGSSLVLARTAAIMSVIPLCSPGLILGIPFGIWALIILSQQKANEAFTS